MSEEQLTISQILRAARQERGLDIDTVYRDTSISLPVLTGLEKNRFDIIEPVFSRMALLAYADYLGLNTKPLLERFDQENGPIVPPLAEATPAPPTSTPKSRLPIPLETTSLRTIGLGLGVLAVLLLAISLLNSSDAPATANAPSPQPAQAPKSVPAPPTQPVGVTLPKPTPPGAIRGAQSEPEHAEPTPPVVTPAPAPTAGVALVLSVEAVDSTWIQIRWDDAGEFQGIVPRGERRSWQADDHFLVLSGRAHGLRYSLNDELLGDGQLGAATKLLRFRANAYGIEFLDRNFQPLTSEAAPDQP